jgi:hypothetical protein
MAAVPTIFYSWQSDHPATRSFVRAALGLAAERASARVEDSIRVDSGTQGIPGTPAIADTIFRRIDDAAVFVADVTFIGKSDKKSDHGDLKRLPGPNVLVELGYAIARLGWERIVLVMNIEFGPAERLPFGLRSRRYPTTFLAKRDGRNKAVLRDMLVETLFDQISTGIASQLSAAEDVTGVIKP